MHDTTTERTRENCGNYDFVKRVCEAVKPEFECDPFDPRFDPADCPFWATRKEVKECYEQRMKNIAGLDEETREHVSLKYYDGKHPWEKYVKK